MSIKIGIIGAGQFAQHFIPLFNAHPQVRSVLLADLDERKRTAAATKYGVAATCATLEDVLASDVDAIALFTQHWMHGPQAMSALRAGKHVYSAVPCAASLEESAALVRAVETSGLIYQMGETSYYYPHVCWAREQHRKGFFGDITLLEAGYYHDWDITSIDSRGIIAARTTPGNFLKIAGSPPMHYPTHTMSQAIAVTGAHMTRVSALGWVDRHPDGIYDPAVNAYANPFSNQTALCAMSDGAAARLNEFRRVGHPGGEFMNVWGTRASLEYSLAGAVAIGHSFGDTRRLDDLFKLRPETHGGTALAQPVERLPREFSRLPNNHWGSHQFLADDFVRACITGEPPPTNVWQAARYLVPGFIAHESCKQGGVQLPVPDYGAGPRPEARSR